MPRGDQWILVAPCDCPSGVMEGYLAGNEEEAMEEMYDYSERKLAEARRRGMRMRLISFDAYTSDYYPRMATACPHETRSK